MGGGADVGGGGGGEGGGWVEGVVGGKSEVCVGVGVDEGVGVGVGVSVCTGGMRCGGWGRGVDWWEAGVTCVWGMGGEVREGG